ncbi:MAG: hypothetical protein RLY57_291 [Candidatus Parcubacteria bacterium]|jgi:hypothetical protein
MKKFISFVILLATLVLTGCDAKWGGSDPVLPPEVHNNYSLFGSGGSKAAPAANSKLPDRPCNETCLPPGTVSGVVTNPPRGDNHQAQQLPNSNSGRMVGRIFSLPSRNYPGVLKKVTIFVPENEPIHVTLKKLRDNGDCFEDYERRVR